MAAVEAHSASKVFLSYHHPDDARFVKRVADYLKTQSSLAAYVFPEYPPPNAYSDEIAAAIHASDSFVLFVGNAVGNTQVREFTMAVRRWQAYPITDSRLDLLVVHLCDDPALPATTAADVISQFRLLHPIKHLPPESGSQVHERNAQAVAHDICLRLGAKWRPYFGLPVGYPFGYEKQIIEEYVAGNGELSDIRVSEGCPRTWPAVRKRPADIKNRVSEGLIGSFSKEDSAVVVDARVPQLDRGPDSTGHLTFAEARPRARLYLPRPERLGHSPALNVGILVSGGIAPGINAVISGIVARHGLYAKTGAGSRDPGQPYHCAVYGLLNGFRSLAKSGAPDAIRFHDEDWTKKITEQANAGGSVLGTSRLDQLMGSDDAMREAAFKKMLSNLENTLNLDILYVIGGDGSMRAAHALHVMAQEAGQNIAIVGIPKTMDNDVLWVWQSFGFLSAVQKAREFIMQLHTEAESNPRVCVMQLFGSDSGFVVSHAAVATGVVDLALIPEIPFSMKAVSHYITGILRERRLGYNRDVNRIPHALILMAETAIPVDVEEYIARDRQLNEEDRVIRLEPEEHREIERYIRQGNRVVGQTPDALRTGGLKIVSRQLQHDIKQMEGDYWSNYRVFTNEPRHLLRSLEPSSSDIVFGRRLGCLAVDNAMAGYTDFMISQWLTEFVLVPLDLVVLGRKRVPPDGIFWKSVLDSTGQPPSLV